MVGGMQPQIVGSMQHIHASYAILVFKQTAHLLAAFFEYLQRRCERARLGLVQRHRGTFLTHKNASTVQPHIRGGVP